MQAGTVCLSQQSAHIVVDTGDYSLLVVGARDKVAIAAGAVVVWMMPCAVGKIVFLLVGCMAVVSSSLDHPRHRIRLALEWAWRLGGLARGAPFSTSPKRSQVREASLVPF